MKFENTEVFNFDGALRGMRNPMNSWSKSDSYFKNDIYYIGEEDLKLAQKLIRAGSEHRKFLRQILVSVDITAPIFWWKEFETYKVGTVANSTSTMHKLANNPITLDCFETDNYSDKLTSTLVCGDEVFTYYSSEEPQCIIDWLESLRQMYIKTKDKRYWNELVRWLPSGWLQTRTITMNYENVLNMIRQRSNHKLNEWSGKDNPDLPNFISWAKSLPYAGELLFVL